MDQCKHCICRGDIIKCLETSCSYHELWMVNEIKKITNFRSLAISKRIAAEPGIQADACKCPCGSSCLFFEEEKETCFYGWI